MQQKRLKAIKKEKRNIFGVWNTFFVLLYSKIKAINRFSYASAMTICLHYNSNLISKLLLCYNNHVIALINELSMIFLTFSTIQRVYQSRMLIDNFIFINDDARSLTENVIVVQWVWNSSKPDIVERFVPNKQGGLVCFCSNEVPLCCRVRH